MKRTWMAGAASVMALGMAIGLSAQAETEPGFVAPKTAWGAPDLQGFWNNTSLTGMTRPSTADKLVASEEEVRELVRKNLYTVLTEQQAGASDLEDDLLTDGNNDAGYNAFWIDPGTTFAKVKGEYRTSWITTTEDGQIPYKEGAKRPGLGYSPTDFSSYETRPLAERCIMSFSGGAGPVMTNSMYNNTFQIVQSPDHVMILVEMIHDTRIIPIDKDFNPQQPAKWAGESRGWYDGDTLVVETRNVHPSQRSYISDQGKVTERFTRWSDGQIFYEFEVEDPTLYREAWGGEMALNQGGVLYEYACHEGNYAMYNALRIGRMQDAGVISADNSQAPR